MCGVVITFEDIVFKTVEPLVYRRTESRKVSRKGLVMCCCVVEEIFLEDARDVTIANGGLRRGSISRVDVSI